MRKIIIFFLFFLIPIAPLQVQAKLYFFSPQEMISYSDHIIIGTIKKRIYGEHHRKVNIAVETFLKGDMNKSEIIVNGDKDPIYGWLDFTFQKKEQRCWFF
jgi:hypothetical protein